MRCSDEVRPRRVNPGITWCAAPTQAGAGGLAFAVAGDLVFAGGGCLRRPPESRLLAGPDSPHRSQGSRRAATGLPPGGGGHCRAFAWRRGRVSSAARPCRRRRPRTRARVARIAPPPAPLPDRGRGRGASPGRPGDGAERRWRSSLLTSQPVRTVLAPDRRAALDRSMSSVMTSVSVGWWRDGSSSRRTMNSSAVARPAYRTSTPEATCRATSPCSGEPSRTTVMATAGGTMARSRPIRAAAGSGVGDRWRAWSTLLPSTTIRATPSSTRRSSGTRDHLGRPIRPRSGRGPRGVRRRIRVRAFGPQAAGARSFGPPRRVSRRTLALRPVASRPCSCSSISMASSIAALSPSRGWPPSWPPGPPPATRSCTSPTTR